MADAVEKARIITSSTTRHVDHSTGEVVSTEETNVIRIPREPPYVKMYIDDLSRIVGLSAGAQSVLYELASKIDYEGIVTITKGTRNRIAEKTGLKETTVRNRISDLVAARIMMKAGYCEYEMNPDLFAKGDWQDIHKRRQAFEFKVRYSETGERSISAKAVW
ncbi:replication/maintenance protein RepL [Aeromonas caviae]|jgi:hypothetical protein|uniref:replication/maintenance protein RepL n=1 Tax=Aeromonas caviae TaxID=648 RepID=UPI00244C1E09|nr:replication/maintenance protein RepL [Aeromonas caviae]MDH0939268.1 replication/maintenance protein RepL [Aeromonas caviae]MDH1852160.1 replication/maintenance protein RepL [Aeromonas caviae]